MAVGLASGGGVLCGGVPVETGALVTEVLVMVGASVGWLVSSWESAPGAAWQAANQGTVIPSNNRRNARMQKLYVKMGCDASLTLSAHLAAYNALRTGLKSGIQLQVQSPYKNP